MATKREMAERLRVLGEQLGTFIPTAGLNHGELEAVVVEAEAKLVEFEAKVAAEAAEKAASAADAAAGAQGGASKPPPAPASIAPGRYRIGKAALTSPRGILAPGKMLRPGDVTPDALQQLLRAGLVVDTEAATSPPPLPEVSDGPAGPSGG